MIKMTQAQPIFKKETYSSDLIRILKTYLSDDELSEIVFIIQTINPLSGKQISGKFKKKLSAGFQKKYEKLEQICKDIDPELFKIGLLHDSQVYFKYFIDTKPSLSYEIATYMLTITSGKGQITTEIAQKLVGIFYQNSLKALAEIIKTFPTEKNNDLLIKTKEEYMLFIEKCITKQFEDTLEAAMNAFYASKSRDPPPVLKQYNKSLCPFSSHSRFNREEAIEFLNNRWQEAVQQQKDHPQTISIASP